MQIINKVLFPAATVLWAITAIAAPSITGVSGNVSHGQSISISGSEFGGKSTAAPVAWDNCNHGQDITIRWSGAWPESAYQPTSAPRYTTPINGVPTAHSNASKYLAGRADAVAWNSGGFPRNVMVWKTRTISSYPVYSYISWYQRVDPNSNFGGNFKYFDFSTGNTPYTMNSSSDSNWYIEYVGGVGNSHHWNDDGESLYSQVCNGYFNSDYLCNSNYMGGSVNVTTQWAKIELIIKYTDQNDGWYDVFENGVLKRSTANTGGTGQHSYNGPTDRYTGTSRNEGIGGYGELGNTNNWRYFNDLYLDYTQARVMLGNANTLATSTVREPQPATLWDSGSISVTVNAGALADSSTAYLYVVDSSGEVNSTGYPVTIGESGGSTPTCSDGIQNGDETGVDCGGSCSACSAVSMPIGAGTMPIGAGTMPISVQ